MQLWLYLLSWYMCCFLRPSLCRYVNQLFFLFVFFGLTQTWLCWPSLQTGPCLMHHSTWRTTSTQFPKRPRSHLSQMKMIKMNKVVMIITSSASHNGWLLQTTTTKNVTVLSNPCNVSKVWAWPFQIIIVCHHHHDPKLWSYSWTKVTSLRLRSGPPPPQHGLPPSRGKRPPNRCQFSHVMHVIVIIANIIITINIKKNIPRQSPKNWLGGNEAWFLIWSTLLFFHKKMFSTHMHWAWSWNLGCKVGIAICVIFWVILNFLSFRTIHILSCFIDSNHKWS